MNKSAFIVRDEIDSHRLLINHRDWLLLYGPQFKEGPQFGSTFGVYENFTVARGIPDGSRVIRPGHVLHGATQALLWGIERDSELLGYDYFYHYAQERSRLGGAMTIQLRGLSGILSARPKGYCSIELFARTADGQQRLAEFIDLRVVGSVQIDTGAVIKVHRRKARMHWLETLPALLEFLRTRLDKDLVVEHYERAKSTE